MSYEEKSSYATYEVTTASAAARWTVFLYGVAAYIVGVAGLLAIIAAFAGIIPPAYRINFTALPWQAVVANIALVGVFGLQHSIMARPAFKEKWTRIVPVAIERSTYVLISGIVLGAVALLWQPIPTVVWDVQQPVLWLALWALFAFGWLYMLGATYAINHYDLFGLRQVYLFARGQDYRAIPFQKRWMYRFSRHPIQAGILIGIWATPHMTAGHLVISAAFTVYIAIGLWFEERDLVRTFGDRYRDYRKEAGAFFTFARGGST